MQKPAAVGIKTRRGFEVVHTFYFLQTILRNSFTCERIHYVSVCNCCRLSTQNYTIPLLCVCVRCLWGSQSLYFPVLFFKGVFDLIVLPPPYRYLNDIKAVGKRRDFDFDSRLLAVSLTPPLVECNV